MDKNLNTKINGKYIKVDIHRSTTDRSKSVNYFVRIFKLVFMFRIYRGDKNIQMSLNWKTGSTAKRPETLRCDESTEKQKALGEAKNFPTHLH